MSERRITSSPPVAVLRLKIVLGEGGALGHGKVDLLEAIAETGSIRAAGNRFRMSYRRAWELTAELNRMFREPLVVAEAGGKGGGGAVLTPLGRTVVDLFRRIQSFCADAAGPDLEELASLLREPEPPPEA